MTVPFYRQLTSLLAEGRSTRSVTFLDGALPAAASTGHSWLWADTVLVGSLGATIDERLLEACQQLSRRKPAVVVEVDCGDGAVCRCLLELHEPAPRLLLVGAGHIAQSLARLAFELGFAIRVFDDRPAFIEASLFPAGTELVLGGWTDVAQRMEPGPADYVVIVTHAHVGDYDALVSLATCQVAYLGMIGSKRKVTTLLERAAAAGVDKDALERVYSPIGLAIGAETPAEIALSIMAEMVALARGADPGAAGSCSVVGHKG